MTGSAINRLATGTFLAPGGRGERLAWLALLTMGLIFGIGWALSGARPIDADVYWRTNPDALYGQAWAPGHELVYLYPPPLAQAMVVLRLLGWPLFIVLWTVALFAATAYAGRVWALGLVIVGLALFPFVGFEHPVRHPLLYPLLGNVQPILVAAIVAGFRFPGLWSIVILTKLTPGIGIVWFALRREWRSLALALGATVAVGLASFALGPDLWVEFVSFAIRNAGAEAPGDIVTVSLPVRLAMSLVLLIWGARTNRRWTVPVAAGWSLIAQFEWSFVEFWMAAPVLWAMDRRDARRRATPGDEPA